MNTDEHGWNRVSASTTVFAVGRTIVDAGTAGIDPGPAGPPSKPLADAVTVRVGEKPKREKKPKAKNDPQHVAAARELRDRYLEHINSDPTALPSAQTKYQVCKQIEVAANAPALPAPIAA